MTHLKHKWSKNSFAHRRLKITEHYIDPQKGEDVVKLQEQINERAEARGLPKIKVDGHAGRATIARGRQVAKSLGIGLRGEGLSVYVQHLIRHPKARTPKQIARGKKWVKHHSQTTVVIKGNHVTGGEPRERLVAACEHAAYLSATGKRRSFYSQWGAWDVDHGITGEARDKRSDCSQWAIAMSKAAGLPDPAGTGYAYGNTGTLGQHGQYIHREDLEPGDKVLYGPAPHHHVEIWVGNGDGKTSYRELARMGHPDRDTTIGHGSPPVDEGDIDMIAGPRFSRAVL